MAQGYKYGGPDRGDNEDFDPNYNKGSTVQGHKYQPGVPSAPSDLRWKVQSHEEASVYWTLPSGQGVTSVKVQLWKPWGSKWMISAEKDFDNSTQAVTVKINGPLENHKVQVQAINNFGIGKAASIRLGYM